MNLIEALSQWYAGNPAAALPATLMVSLEVALVVASRAVPRRHALARSVCYDLAVMGLVCLVAALTLSVATGGTAGAPWAVPVIAVGAFLAGARTHDATLDATLVLMAESRGVPAEVLEADRVRREQRVELIGDVFVLGTIATLLSLLVAPAHTGAYLWTLGGTWAVAALWAFTSARHEVRALSGGSRKEN